MLLRRLRRLRRTWIPMRGIGCGTGYEYEYRINEGPRCGGEGVWAWASKSKMLWHRGSDLK